MSQQRDHDQELIDDALALLGEHYDTVQVFVTRHDSEEVGTIGMSKGLGNVLARYGQIKRWVMDAESCSRAGSELTDQG